ncbi:UDP-N-acetylmuramoyl-tripeptide--D-alanyl-D-alanine ligase [Desulfonatronovibrio hydrogenovorans]|uniref:UDP-N-acetylmuramoyl-tripeptide--D-alanyl-D- alanine ligase n=1 Tax=Desulfonatronovibrio hydrogenovorans TaxID=53245 RepID=UPI00048B12A2|nr:UDP-N-acetylmuramoyl-tripeptide--D-alanyl-D-alanine ligase [Desulfonatronovibrio hydrogenovorans]
MNMTLEEVASALKSVGDLNGAEKAIVTDIRTDSRLVRPGDLFLCLCGKRMDGHNFAEQAAKKGALAVVSHNPMPDLQVPVLLVDDTLKALGRMARYWRLKKGKMVMAITGSVGKTTTKEMISFVLGTRFRVGKNHLNWNNQVGLPLSILKFSGEEDCWVLELGINNQTDMDELGEICVPDLAVIINIGPCHLEGLGSIAGVAMAKSRILDHLQGAGPVLASRDYPLLEKEIASRPDISPVWFSCRQAQADYKTNYLGGNRFQVQEYGQVFEIQTQLRGAHYCENISATWALARHLGIEPELIIRAINQFKPPEQRFSIEDLGKWTIIDDTYNANPLSMSKAMASAKGLAGTRPLFLILGDMAELGESEANAHLELGREITQLGCQGVFFHGRNTRNVFDGLGQELMNRFYSIADCSGFKAALDQIRPREGVLLFKGSRSAGMEEYVSCFKEWAGGVLE